MDVQAFTAERPLLHTERLILRPFDEADAPAVQALAGAREIADTTLHIPHPYPPGAAAVWIATHAATWESATGATYAIVARDEGALVGAIGLAIGGPHASGELGYWIGVPHWNRGYATEAARAMLALAFGSLRLRRVHAHHLTRNPSSGRVMQKVGMQLEGVHRQAVRKWDQFEDIAAYAILAGDWLATRRALPSGYTYIWEYVVAPEHVVEFERIYGPDGAWARLFLRAAGYLRTELHRDRARSSRFVTIDYWESEAAWNACRTRFAKDFDELDARGAALTTSEIELGCFVPLAQPRQPQEQ